MSYSTCQLNGAEEIERALRAAIKTGYRHIDCAYMYWNEKEIGNALQKLYNEGVVQREDLFITSKLSLVLWNNGLSMLCMSSVGPC